MTYKPDYGLKLLRDGISKETDASSQRTFDLENPFYVDITIRLGELQQNQYESFVPFILHKVN